MSSAVTHAAVPRIAPRFRFQWEQAQNAWVLLYPEGMIRLNASAGAILKHLDPQRNVADVIALLRAEFPGAADLEPDIMEFLEHAHGRGWIILD